MNTSTELGELAKALAACQGELRPALKDSTNPHFRSSYADLASVWEACRAALSKHGLSVVQGCRAEGKALTVETMLLHASGQWISDALTLEAMNATPQALGSATTYARRYGLAAMVGIAPEDDDGEAAQGRPKDQAKGQQKNQWPEPPPAETETPPTPDSPKLDAATISFFQKMTAAKNTLGEQAYRRVLGVNGFESSKEIRDPKLRETILNELRAEVRERKAAA